MGSSGVFASRRSTLAFSSRRLHPTLRRLPFCEQAGKSPHWGCLTLQRVMLHLRRSVLFLAITALAASSPSTITSGSACGARGTTPEPQPPHHHNLASWDFASHSFDRLICVSGGIFGIRD